MAASYTLYPLHILSRHLTVVPATPLLRAQAIPRGGLVVGWVGRVDTFEKKSGTEKELSVCL